MIRNVRSNLRSDARSLPGAIIFGSGKSRKNANKETKKKARKTTKQHHLHRQTSLRRRCHHHHPICQETNTSHQWCRSRWYTLQPFDGILVYCGWRTVQQRPRTDHEPTHLSSVAVVVIVTAIAAVLVVVIVVLECDCAVVIAVVAVVVGQEG